MIISNSIFLKAFNLFQKVWSVPNNLTSLERTRWWFLQCWNKKVKVLSKSNSSMLNEKLKKTMMHFNVIWNRILLNKIIREQPETIGKDSTMTYFKTSQGDYFHAPFTFIKNMKQKRLWKPPTYMYLALLRVLQSHTSEGGLWGWFSLSNPASNLRMKLRFISWTRTKSNKKIFFYWLEYSSLVVHQFNNFCPQSLKIKSN